MFATLRKSKRETTPHTSQPKVVSHLLLTNRTKTYLRNMKSKVLTFFLLLTGICYLMQTMELDGNERKQNYEKETHTYISCTKTTETFNLTSPTADIAIDFLYHNFFIPTTETISSEIYFKDPDPPQRLYLRHSVFLI